MRQPFIIFLSVFLAALAWGTSSRPDAKKTTFPNTIMVKDLQGSWKRVKLASLLYSETNPLLAPDANEYTTYYRTNIFITGDSMYTFEYPAKYHGACSIRIANGDSLYYNEAGRAAGKLERTETGFVLNSFHRVWKTRPVREIWTRDTLDPGIIGLLKKDSVNYGCLVGWYELVTRFQPDDGEAYEVIFPADVPFYLSISDKKKARTVATARRVIMSINGKPLDFQVTDLFWNENDSREDNSLPGMVLEPGNWWKGETFSMYYKFVPGKIPAGEWKKIKKAGR